MIVECLNHPCFHHRTKPLVELQGLVAVVVEVLRRNRGRGFVVAVELVGKLG